MPLKGKLVKLINGWALLGGALLILIVLVTAINAAGFTANAIARIWDGRVSGLPGYEDAVQMVIGVAALTMFPYAQLHRAHASVDVFMQHAPKWVDRSISVLCGLGLAAFTFWMAYMLVRGMLEVRSDGVETTVLGWPVWVFMPSAIVSCVLWGCAALLSLDPETEPADGT